MESEVECRFSLSHRELSLIQFNFTAKTNEGYVAQQHHSAERPNNNCNNNSTPFEEGRVELFLKIRICNRTWPSRIKD